MKMESLRRNLTYDHESLYCLASIVVEHKRLFRLYRGPTGLGIALWVPLYQHLLASILQNSSLWQLGKPHQFDYLLNLQQLDQEFLDQ